MLTYESVIYTNLTSKFFVDQVISAYDGKGGLHLDCTVENRKGTTFLLR